MNTVYDSPKSNDNLLNDEAEKLSQLLSQQRLISGQIVAFVGTISLFLIMFSVEGRTPLLIYLTPSITMGAVLKYFACFVTMKPRIISASIVALVTMGFLSLFGITIFSIFFVFLAFLACIALNRRTLDMDQEKLLYSWRIGKLKI